MIKKYIFLILLMSLPVYSAEISNYVNKGDIETSKRIFILKPKEESKKISEDKENKIESPPPSVQNQGEKDKKIPVIQKSMRLINIDSSEMIPRLKDINTAKITGLGKEIILKGTTEEINELKYIIEKFDQPKKQIQIKATIIDTSDNLFERLGVDFSAGKNNDNKISDFTGSFLDGNFSLSALLKKGGNFLGINVDALKENGDIKIEAMPVLLILEGSEGELRVTEEVIVGEKKYTDKNEEYVEPVFAEAGVVFKIKPEIRGFGDSQEIILYIDSEISNFKLSSNFNADQGAKQKNKINSIVSFKDGTSIFIGGLKQNVQKDSEKRVPVLSKIPILGSLFKYKRKNKEVRDIYIEIEGKIQTE
ncbi:general secretion pathway protein GspD [Sebaldella sp. S0638]|uniref:type II secretion system protein GspD n=1 Tax=Sebaldella sp. S0638 TaxID=2957809 RepID=UPI00209D149F|nr:general secretion pathway protein GspD [Sebaldella sp. S0638]